MTTETNKKPPHRVTTDLEAVTIRFVGDSGDGMQLTGTQFSDTSALFGNDIATFPNYPSEIRAPQGSLYGVSGFQVHFGRKDIATPGDEVDVLVAMNPAALKMNIKSLKPGQMLIVDSDAFTKKNLEKAHYDSNPLEDGSLENYKVIEVAMTTHTRDALKDMDLDNKSILRSKNMFALGMVYFIFHRPMEHTLEFLQNKFKNKPKIIEANTKVLKAGYYFAETLELISTTYTVAPAEMPKGTYRMLNGNTATAWGLIAAKHNSGLELFLGSYPITPATDILQEMVKHSYFGIKTFQAEDEIAGVSSAIGASFAGDLAVTTTSGPGLALKSEAIGLAVMMELPLVVINVQRGGPSTGLPTKTEQSDLLQALYGRNGESPVVVLAASTPANSFDFAYEACKIALEHMTPVILLTDGYIANGAAPWKIKRLDELPPIHTRLVKDDGKPYTPYQRDDDTLARNWAVPGMKGKEHRIGGLEKDKLSGNVSYDPINHQYQVNIRAEKVKRVQNSIPAAKAEYSPEGDLLVIGWGGTYGSLSTTVDELNKEGYKVGHLHFNYINPLPSGVPDILSKYKNIIVCELNKGQFVKVLRSQFGGFRFQQFNKIQGLPFSVSELREKFKQIISHNE